MLYTSPKYEHIKCESNHSWTVSGISHAFYGREKKHKFLTWILQINLNYYTTLDLAEFTTKITQSFSYSRVFKTPLCFSQISPHVRHLPEEITWLSFLSPASLN